jgi:hypothetical protein
MLGGARHYIEAQWNLSVEIDTVRHVLKHDGRLRTCESIPMTEMSEEPENEAIGAELWLEHCAELAYDVVDSDN